MKHLNSDSPSIFLVPALSLIIFMSIIPLVYSIYWSFHSFSLTPAPFRFVGLANFERLIRDQDIYNSAIRTVLYIVPAIFLQGVLGLGIGLLLNNSALKCKRIMRIAIEVPIILTPAVVGIVWKLMLTSELGLLNTFLHFLGLPKQFWLSDRLGAVFAVILMDTWQWTPFVVLIVIASLQFVPKNIHEMAKIDGASNFQTFRCVTFPLIKRTFYVAILLRIIDAMKMFDQTFTLTRGGPALGSDFFSLLLYRKGLVFGYVSYASAISWVYLLIFAFFIIIFIKASQIRV